MEILSERTNDDKERNAFTIRSIHSTYTVKVDCEPVLRFQWNLDTEHWEYSSSKHYAYSTEVLNPNEILIRIPLDDSTPIVHKPYVDDMSHPDIVYKLENAVDFVMNLPEPMCAMKLKEALLKNKNKR